MKKIVIAFIIALASACGGSDEELLRQYANPNAAAQMQIQPVDTTATSFVTDDSNVTGGRHTFRLQKEIDVVRRHEFKYYKDFSSNNIRDCHVVINFNEMSVELVDVHDTGNFSTSVTFSINSAWSFEFNQETGNIIMVASGSNTNVPDIPIRVFLNKEDEVIKVQIAKRTYLRTKPANVAQATHKEVKAAYGDANMYKVKTGDHANSISADHNLTLRQFLEMNPKIVTRKGYAVYPNEFVRVY